jgi:hypothetical protein
MRTHSKKIIMALAFLAICPVRQYALHLEAGLFFGPRTVIDSRITEVYGHASVYYPYLAFGLWKGLAVGVGNEGGYSKQGKIGLYKEPTTLEMGGTEFFVRYEHPLAMIFPYIKIGYGSYSYQQIIQSQHTGGRAVDHSKTALSFGAGVRIFPLKGLFLAAEVKYMPFKVKPFEDEVNLGGMRYMVGIGCRVRL